MGFSGWKGLAESACEHVAQAGPVSLRRRCFLQSPVAWLSNGAEEKRSVVWFMMLALLGM